MAPELESNPYAPAEIDVDFSADVEPVITYKAHNRALKWICVAALFVLIELIMVLGTREDEKAWRSLCMVIYLVADRIWIYSAWSAIPIAYRATNSGRVISPRQAVSLSLVPVYSIYWSVVANRGLCEALNRMLATTKSSRKAPRELPLAAAVSLLLILLHPVALIVAPVLWVIFMFRVDSASKELERALLDSSRDLVSHAKQQRSRKKGHKKARSDQNAV